MIMLARVSAVDSVKPEVGMAWEIPIRRVAASMGSGDFDEIVMQTDRGPVTAREYPAAGAPTGVVLAGGAGGGWDSPAKGLYPRLASTFSDDGTTAVCVRFRDSRNLDESTHDVLAALSFLRGKGVFSLGLVGHSFGGAVAIRAAAVCDEAGAVAALSTQSFGTEPVGLLSPRCALLLLHGTADSILPPSCSEQVFAAAGEPKKIALLDGAGHALTESAGVVEEEVLAWMKRHLTRGSRR
jgi:dienelactone hydrolase